MATPDAVDVAAIASASASYPLPAPGFSIGYGTAGFRTTAELLDSTVFRCGLLVGVRALLTQRACGVMVTASHNPVADNGVKLVEPGGEMLPQAWEPLATELACASDDAQVAAIVASALSQPPPCHASDTHGAHAAAMQRPAPAVLIGCDTRPSAARLVAAASAGVRAMGVEVLDAGTVTTPQLHFMVAARNAGPSHPGPPASLPLYYDTLLGAMEQLVEGLAPVGPTGSEMHVDCANGVGMRMLQAAAPRLAGLKLNLKLHNTGGRRADGWMRCTRCACVRVCAYVRVCATRCCSGSVKEPAYIRLK
jgi:phosphoacetylglucosamine mutase